MLSYIYQDLRPYRSYTLLLITQHHMILACFLYGDDEIVGTGQGAGEKVPPSLELPLFWYVCSLGSVFYLFRKWLCSFKM